MDRILEFNSEDEATVVGRILMQVHRAVDENFPTAEPAPRQFTKTVFNQNESTAIVRPPRVDDIAVSSEPVSTPPSSSNEKPLVSRNLAVSAYTKLSEIELMNVRTPSSIWRTVRITIMLALIAGISAVIYLRWKGFF